MSNFNPTHKPTSVSPSHENEVSTDKQVQYLCVLAFGRCGIELDELDGMVVKFAAMNRKQASDLIASWKELPEQRKSPWGWKYSTWTRAIGCVERTPGVSYHALPDPSVPVGTPTAPAVVPRPYVAPAPPIPTPAPQATTYARTAAPERTVPKFNYPEAGYYAVEVPIDGKMTMRFYRVTQKRGSTYKNFRRMSSDNAVSVNLMEQYLACTIIGAAPRLAQETYGRLIGRCGCCGRTLTDEQSRADGIGPECIKRFQS